RPLLAIKETVKSEQNDSGHERHGKAAGGNRRDADAAEEVERGRADDAAEDANDDGGEGAAGVFARENHLGQEANDGAEANPNEREVGPLREERRGLVHGSGLRRVGWL